MTAIEDRPTLPERYARALESTHLELVLDERCSVDMLIAAGWVKEGLGTLLHRLRIEYDATRGAHRQALVAMRDALAHADRVRAEAKRCGSEEQAARLYGIAQHIARSAEGEALMAKALVLSAMKTLPAAKDALGQFASLTATRERYMQPDEVVWQITGRALEVWMDPACPHCMGTGLAGGVGVVAGICPHCHGSKLRPYRLHHTDAGHQFGRSLMNHMDRKCDYVTGQMRRYLSQR